MKIAAFWQGHDCSFCVFENGVPIIHAELERYIREKEPNGDSYALFLDVVGKFEDIDYVVGCGASGVKNILRNRPEWKNSYPECTGRPVPDLSKQINDPRVKSQLAWQDNELIQIGHHKCHAASAFYSSNLDESLIVTIDGGGREESSADHPAGKATCRTVWFGQDNKIHPIDMGFNDLEKRGYTIGQLWSHYTGQVFGLSTGHPYGHSAGTVMGMAALGDKNKYLGDITRNPMGFIAGATKIAEEGEQAKFDIAAALQQFTENWLESMIRSFVENPELKGYCKNLCLSGGVALNCVAVGKLLEKFDFEHIHVDPVPYDGGLVLGAAQYVYYHLLENDRIKWKDNFTPYLGELYSKEQVEAAISKNNDKITFESATIDNVVDLLDDQKIVSVFNKGSESGRRALGNRSILADPRSTEMKDIINEKVKHRQWFRPFAPSILREEVKNWFIYDIESPYMNFAIPFKKEMKDKVPAVVHFDGTARLQTVTENNNKWYYTLIKKFHEKTGVPILLNTSFNDREPIVETPEHAINCFLGTNIDYLYFCEYNILIKRI